MGREIWSQARIPFTSNTLLGLPSLGPPNCGKRAGPAGPIGCGQCLLSVVCEGRSVSQTANSAKVKLNNTPQAFGTLKKQVSSRLNYYYHGNMRGLGRSPQERFPVPSRQPLNSAGRLLQLPWQPKLEVLLQH